MRIILDNVEYYWNFIVADVPIAIIGADFLAYFDLLIDCKNETLIYRNNKLVNHQIYKRNMDSVINLIKYCPKTKITTYHSKKKENICNKFIKTINTINNLKKIKDEKAINLKNKTENLVTKQTSLKEIEPHSEDKTSKTTNIRKTGDDKTLKDLSSCYGPG